MERELSGMPHIGAEEIDPRGQVPEAHREAQHERHEQKESLSQKILEWWRGDIHTHTTSSTREGFGRAEGVYTPEEIRAYYKGLGLEFVAFTEHSSDPSAPERLSVDHPISQSLLKGAETVEELNEKDEGFAAFSGVEANVMFDDQGEAVMDVPDEVLENLDVVIASRHRIEKEHDLNAIHKSLMMAAEQPHVDVLGHIDRYIRVEHNWDLFRKNHPDAQIFHQEMAALQKKKSEASPEEQPVLEEALQQRYRVIRKVIGRNELGGDDEHDTRLREWREQFQEMEQHYWENMDDVLGVMAKKKKALELNLGAMPSPKLVEKAAQHNIPFLINFDAHDFDKYKWFRTPEQKKGAEAKEAWAQERLTPEDEEVLLEYKLDRLTSGPGIRPILRLVRQIRQLEKLGVTPDRVVNSSKEGLLRFLTETRGKHTKNLDNLAEKQKRPTTSSRVTRSDAGGEEQV